MRSQIRLSFNSQEDGANLSFPIPDGSRQFNCEELKATLSKSGSEIILSGNIDGRVKYEGVIQANSISKLNVLRYLSSTLAKKNHQGPTREFSQMMEFITNEISVIVLNNEKSGIDIVETSEIYAPDLSWKRIRKSSKRNLLKKRSSENQKMVLFSSLTKQELGKLPYGALSGFINLEINSEEEPYDKGLWEREGIEFHDLQINPERGVLARVEVRLSVSLMPESMFFFHVMNSETSEWFDVEGQIVSSLKESDIVTIDLPLSKEFNPGKLQFTFFVQGRYESRKIWMSQPGESYSANVSYLSSRVKTKDRKEVSHDFQSLHSFDSISRWCKKLLSKGPLDSSDVFSDKEFSDRFMLAYQEALRKLGNRPSKIASNVIKAVRTLGINHLYMVSPEGPNAMAGGLAQVVKGLSMRFSSEGVPVTVISPLYEKGVGASNQGAEEVVANGFSYLGQNLSLKNVGDVLIPYGELSGEELRDKELSGSESSGSEPRRFYRAKIYTASSGKTNFVFLRHKKFTDRLYGGISGRDLIERGIFLSKGALETIKASSTLTKKGILLSNDWLSALLSPFLEYDSKYEDLADIRVMHVLHNAGRGYQSRITRHEDGNDLVQLLDLPGESVAKVLEDGNEGIINLTQACLRASKYGTLTVSKPYAEQLLTEEHGEGLNKILSNKEVYGISNGISEALVRESAFGDSVGSESNLTMSDVSDLKQSLLLEAQESLGLNRNADAILAVMIGRLTEQKGIGIISPLNSESSVFEAILKRYPKVQIAVVGPGSEKEEEFIKFRDHLAVLKDRFPGRVACKFEFVDPSQAIRYTAGASIFLMPSRYEPGGLTQLEALCVGTSVVAHRVGGLSATLSQFSEFSGSSFLFEDFSRKAFLRAFNEAVRCFMDKETRELIVDRALRSRNDWAHRIPYYLTLFQEVLGVFQSIPELEDTEFYKNRKLLIKRITACKY